MSFWNLKPKKKFGIQPEEMPKKKMDWNQAKARHPKLSPLGDADRDGVKNWMDCRPFDRKRQDKAQTQEKLKKLKEDIRDIQQDFRDYPDELDEALSDVTDG